MEGREILAGGIVLRDGLPWRSRCGGWAIFLMLGFVSLQAARMDQPRKGVPARIGISTSTVGKGHTGATGESMAWKRPLPASSYTYTHYVHRFRSRSRPQKKRCTALSHSSASVAYHNRARLIPAHQASRPMCLKQASTSLESP